MAAKATERTGYEVRRYNKIHISVYAGSEFGRDLVRMRSEFGRLRKRTGIEPAGRPLPRSPTDFEDRAEHQLRTRFRQLLYARS